MAKRGRPVTIVVDWSKIDTAFSLGATTEMVANFIDVSNSYLEQLIRKKTGLSIGEYRERKLATTQIKLIQKALAMAWSGDRTMMIFSLKNLAGWTDRVEHGFDKDKKTIILKYNLDETKDVTPPVVPPDDNTSDK